MVRLNRGFRSLKGWQVGTLATLLLLIGGAAFGVSNVTGSSEQQAQAETAQTAPRFNAETAEIPIRGKLAFPNTVDLKFETSGTVGAVLVGLQEEVEQGQVLAKLQGVKIADLSEVVAQRRLGLDTAEDQLADLTRAHNQELAQARQAKADAELAVGNTRTALGDFDLDHQQELAQARRAEAAVELALDEAKEILEDFQKDYLLDLAQAQQTKADAGVNLDQALEKLADLVVEHQQKLAEATQAKASAEVALDEAQDRLGNFDLDYNQELAEAMQAEADSELSLVTAEVASDNFRLLRVQELAEARKDITGAETALEDAEDALEAFEDDRAAQQLLAVQAAVDARDDLNVAIGLVAGYRTTGLDPEVLQALLEKESRAREEWVITDNDVFRAGVSPAPLKCGDYNGSQLTLHCQQLQVALELAQTELAQAEDGLAELEGLHQAQLVELTAAVELAQANVSNTAHALTDLNQGPDLLKLQESETAVERTRADLNKAAEDSSSLKSKGDLADIALAEANEAAAEVALRNAEAALTAMRDGAAGALDLALQEVQVASAQANLVARGQARASIVVGVDALEVASVVAEAALARETLVNAETSVAKLLDGPDQLDLAVKNAQVTLIEAALNQAEQDLKNLLDGQDLLERALLERDLDLAKAKVTKADKDLAELGDSPDPLDVQHLEAQIEHLRAALEEAREDLNGAVVRAPFNGVVSVLNVEIDDQVNTKSRVIRLVDPTAVEVRGVVDAAELRFVALGGSAIVTIDSLPTRSLEGTVSFVAAEPRTERGVISYPITIRVEFPKDLQIPVTLSGVTSVVVYEGD